MCFAQTAAKFGDVEADQGLNLLNGAGRKELGKSAAAEIVLVIWSSMLDVVYRSQISSSFCNVPVPK